MSQARDANRKNRPNRVISGLDWRHVGDAARAKLAEYGLTEADAENEGIKIDTIADCIQDFHELALFSEIMANQCQITLNNRLHLDDTFTSQICASTFETFQMILLCALHHRCPLIDSEGYSCIASKQPVIYIPESFAFENSLFLSCSYLLLPSSRSIRVIPCTPVKTSDDDIFTTDSLDCDAFLRAIEEDKQAGRMPLCVFATLSTTVYRKSSDLLRYKNDNLARIRQICDTHAVWLHITGADLCFLASKQRPSSVSEAIDAADSFAIRSRDLITTGSDSHILMIRSAQFKEKLKKPAVFDIVTPTFFLLTSIASEIEAYTDAHINATRLLMAKANTDYLQSFKLEASFHSEMRPTFHVVPTCLDLEEVGLTLQAANSFILQGITIENLNCSVVYDSNFDGLQLTVRPFKFDALDGSFCTEKNICEFLDTVEKRVKRLSQGLSIRAWLSKLITEKRPFCWSDRSNFSCKIGIGAFRLVPGFLAEDQHEAANCLNDCLAEQLFKKYPCFRGCLSDDNLISIAILTIPSDCDENMSDEEIAQYIFDVIYKTQAEIQYPSAVIELLSQSLQTGIEEAENYLIEMQNRNFSPFDMIMSVPIIGSVLGWLFNQSDEPDPKNPIALLGQSFDLESKSLSRRSTVQITSLK